MLLIVGRRRWNEMKVVRSVPTHPNIIGFESFIITPSYALVSMPYCPSLMPVGIPEVYPSAALFCLFFGSFWLR